MPKRKKPKPYARLTCARCFHTTANGPLYRQGNVFVCAEHRGEAQQ